MEIIFHIGMGKTGTSSIQRALRDNPDTLKASGAHYIGLWFDTINEQFSGLSGTKKFLSSSAAQMQEYAAEFHRKLAGIQNAEGSFRFILSNEAIFQSAEAILPFLNKLVEDGDSKIKVIAYMRNPADWILSAYSQWGINHKTSTGPIPSIQEFAPSLLSQYDATKHWIADFRGTLDIRAFDPSKDVITDFGQAIGVELKPLPQKILARSELAELILRREFNNSFSTEILPKVFDEVVLGSSPSEVETLDDIVSSIFDPDAVSEMIQSKSSLWSEIKKEVGIDLTEEHNRDPMPDKDDLRDRLLEYLIVLTMKQSKIIFNLELKMKGFEKTS